MISTMAKIKVKWAAKTDIGRIRKINQDNLAALGSEEISSRAEALFVLADGMGGRAGGETASRLAVDAVVETVQRQLAQHREKHTREGLGDIVHAALIAANTSVWGRGRQDRTLKGMGTTCVITLVNDGIAAIGNAGDSRVYLLRDKKLVPLTHDHVLLHSSSPVDADASTNSRSRFHNTITRAVGFGAELDPDVALLPLEERDALLLCSDGLTNTVREEEIARLLGEGGDPRETCEKLIATANRNGGEDNISVIVMHYGDIPEDASQPVNLTPAESSLAPSAMDHTPETAQHRYWWWFFGASVLVLIAGAVWSITGHHF
jgi:PPM family protein phosphatase